MSAKSLLDTLAFTFNQFDVSYGTWINALERYAVVLAKIFPILLPQTFNMRNYQRNLLKSKKLM